jgi:hypothetical protein
MKLSVLAIVIALIVCTTIVLASAQQDLDSLARALNLEIAKLTSPALEQRKRIRRDMQRSGYATVLSDVLAADSFSAIIAFIRMKLQIEYSISHRPVSLRIKVERGEGKVWSIPLSDDWSFPENPWEKQ